MPGIKKLVFIIIIAAFFVLGINLNAYAEGQKPTNKLIAIVLPITTGAPKRGWANPDDVFVKTTYKSVWKHLSKTGVYQLIPWETIDASIKEQKIRDWDWRKDNWALLKKIGKELGADYAFVRERGFMGTPYTSMTLININTGKTFEYQDYIKKEYGAQPGAFIDMTKESYREIFRSAKADLIATAVAKLKVILGEETGKKPEEPVKAAEETKPVIPPAEKKPGKAPEKTSLAEKTDKDKKPLIVYDFNTNEQLKVVALLLAEALREELSSRFKIIAREETLRAVDEMKLQQSGLVDEKYMMSIGKWLSTNESVSGTFGLIGKTYVLQAKRVNMETLEMLSAGSIKASLDKEEELLNGLATLAGSLAKTR